MHDSRTSRKRTNISAFLLNPNQLLAVWDSSYTQPILFTINAATTPALISDATVMTGGSGDDEPVGIGITKEGRIFAVTDNDGAED